MRSFEDRGPYWREALDGADAPERFPEPQADESWPAVEARDAGVGMVFSARDGCYLRGGPADGV